MREESVVALITQTSQFLPCGSLKATVFAGALKEVPGMRDRILIATKCGIRFPGEPKADSPHRYDFSAEHILWSCEQSLKRLGTEYVDIYQLHRPDALMDPHEVAGAFAKLKRAGKVRYFGVSNFTPSQVAALQSAWPELVVNQVRISLAELGCFHDGTLDQCIERNITPLAWSPMGGGFLGTGGTPDAKDEKRVKLVEVMDQIAGKNGTTRTVIALAWLLKHPSKIIPIVGSSNPERIRESVKADEVELDREDWYRLLVAARGQGLA
jgi:predicted oxidoreductase